MPDFLSSMYGLLSMNGLYWIVAPLAAGVLGIVVFLMGAGHLLRGRPARGSVHLLAGAPLAVGGLVLGLLGINVQSYSRLTFEAPVAEVSVAALDPAHSLYAVNVKRADGNAPAQTCRLQGDEWEMSARVQKWKPWANILGLDTTYRLDQISNRYFDAERGNGKTITSCDLKGPPPAVNAWVPQSWLFWVFEHAYVEDRHFGSAAYMPMTDGAVYRVIMTQSGLNAEPANDKAKAANGAGPDAPAELDDKDGSR